MMLCWPSLCLVSSCWVFIMLSVTMLSLIILCLVEFLYAELSQNLLLYSLSLATMAWLQTLSEKHQLSVSLQQRSCWTYRLIGRPISSSAPTSFHHKLALSTIDYGENFYLLPMLGQKCWSQLRWKHLPVLSAFRRTLLQTASQTFRSKKETFFCAAFVSF